MWIRRALHLSAIACAITVAASQATADTSVLPDDPTARRTASQRGHLWRVATWGATSLIGGAIAATALDDQRQPLWRGFAVQSAAWGAVNLGIGASGLLFMKAPTRGAPWPAVHRAERRYHDILLFNMGLNVGYVAIGATAVVASYCGVTSPRAWRGHGAAIIVQGAALLALDGYALLDSRRRLTWLTDLRPAPLLFVDSVTSSPTPVWGAMLSGRW